MADTYSVKINRRDGAVEVSGDKDWVDAKLRELADVYAEPPSDDGGGNGGPSAPTKKQAGKRKATKSTKATGTKQPRRKAGRAQKNAELAGKLTRDAKQKLQGYVDARRAAFDKSATGQMAILAGFLRAEMNMDLVDADDLYTIYSVMGWPSPNILTALTNAYTRDKYFGGVTDGKRELTQNGENFAYHRSLDA